MIRGQVQLERSLVSGMVSDQRAVELIMLAQEQLTSQVPSLRLDDLEDQTVFPPVPEDGYGVFYTPWGMYAACLDGIARRWLRLHTGVLYKAGVLIPTTL